MIVVISDPISYRACILLVQSETLSCSTFVADVLHENFFFI